MTAAKPTTLAVVKGAQDQPLTGTIIDFQMNEADVRLLAKGMVSSEVQESALAAVAWLEDDPIGYQDEGFLKLAKGL